MNYDVDSLFDSSTWAFVFYFLRIKIKDKLQQLLFWKVYGHFVYELEYFNIAG
jgi:hypothetical protein